MIRLNVFCRSIVYSYLVLLARQVKCEEISQCYDGVSICFWTNGSQLTQSKAQTACQQRNNSFLPRITNSNIRDKLALFRAVTNSPLINNGFWIDVTAGQINSFHWLDGSLIVGEGKVPVRDQTLSGERFAVITYDVNKFVFSARHWNNRSSSYICQLRQGARCTGADHLSMKSKCYRKFHNSSSLTWFSASNDCLSRGGSLAVFTDIRRLSDNSQLTQWLNKNKTYWIGLVRSWWQTDNKDIQYSNWEENGGHPNTEHRCVIMAGNKNYWNTFDCNVQQKFVCQNNSRKTTTSSTTSTSTSTTTVTSTASLSSVFTPTTTSRPTNVTTATNDPERPDGQNTIAIAAGVTVAILIIIAVVIVVLVLLLYNRRRSRKPPGGNDKKKPNGRVHKEEGVIYASIEPTRDNNNANAAPNSVSNPPSDVIYSELQASDT